VVNGVVEHETFGMNPDPVPQAGHEMVAWAVRYTMGQHYERRMETKEGRED